MAADPLTPADILIITAADEFLRDPASGNYIDPVWEALRQALGMSGRSQSYSRGSTEFLAELRAHKLHLDERDRYWRLHPRLRTWRGEFFIGRYHRATINGRSVCAFGAELRLNTDGPTMPVLRLLNQLVREAAPRFVLYVGIGGGVRAEHQAGEVVVTGHARFDLRGELESSPINGQTMGGAWTPDPGAFVGLEFAELQEPALLPPSPHYHADDPPQPPPHTPRVRVDPLPVLTRPEIMEPLFDVPSPDPTDRDYRGDIGSAIDMDAAPIGAACGEHLPCAFVIGLASPAIRRFPYDYQGSLRSAWAQHMIELFAAHAARNAAAAARVIIEDA